jgi:uncharacterized phage protein (TIGR01671 family)
METEFKAQWINNKEWVYGYYYKENRINPITLKNEVCHWIKLFKKNGIITDYQVIPKTVCQYIGIKDKNGKKVYDKDRIKSNYHWQKEKGHIISFPEDCYDFMEYLGHSVFDGSICDEIEVIGNKFDETGVKLEKVKI